MKWDETGGMDQLTALRVFVAVAEEQGFAPAARRLDMSTSAVSRHVADLESHLGAALLYRTTRRLSLTESGQRYLAHARCVLEQISTMDAEVGEETAVPKGRLRISAVPVFGEQFLAPAAVAFMRRYPEVRLELDLNERIVDLVAENFDAAIRSGPLPDSSFRARALAEPTYLCCASPEYIARAGAPRHPHELTEHNCIHWYFRGPKAVWRFLDGDQLLSVSVTGRYAVTSALAQREAVRAGLGVALFLPGVVDEDLASGRLVRVLEDYP
ncbi:MAG: LysR family transcriptional regulator, partial [Pseudomonadota bacterium]